MECQQSKKRNASKMKDKTNNKKKQMKQNSCESYD